MSRLFCGTGKMVGGTRCARRYTRYIRHLRRIRWPVFFFVYALLVNAAVNVSKQWIFFGFAADA
jgi:hypothetical protein